MRVFVLSPAPNHSWLAPADAAARWVRTFAQTSVDVEAGRELGEIQAAKYQKLCDAKGYDAKLVERVVQKYHGALMIQAGDDKSDQFKTLICRETAIHLNFESGVPWAARRRIAKKAAAALGYRAEYSEQI